MAHKDLHTWLRIAFSYGAVLEVKDWLGVTQAVTGVKIIPASSEITFVRANDTTLAPAKVAEFAAYDDNCVYVLTPASVAKVHELVTEHNFTTEWWYLQPHLASILEAYPSASCYKLRDHRLGEVHDHVCPAVLIQYSESDDHHPGPMKYHGFSAWSGGKITYTEAEAWRYEKFIP